MKLNQSSSSEGSKNNSPKGEKDKQEKDVVVLDPKGEKDRHESVHLKVKK